MNNNNWDLLDWVFTPDIMFVSSKPDSLILPNSYDKYNCVVNLDSLANAWVNLAWFNWAFLQAGSIIKNAISLPLQVKNAFPFFSHLLLSSFVTVALKGIAFHGEKPSRSALVLYKYKKTKLKKIKQNARK